MIIDMQDIGCGTVVAGALAGKAALARMLEVVPAQPNTPQPIFLTSGKSKWVRPAFSARA